MSGPARASARVPVRPDKVNGPAPARDQASCERWHIPGGFAGRPSNVQLRSGPGSSREPRSSLRREVHRARVLHGPAGQCPVDREPDRRRRHQRHRVRRHRRLLATRRERVDGRHRSRVPPRRARRRQGSDRRRDRGRRPGRPDLADPLRVDGARLRHLVRRRRHRARLRDLQRRPGRVDPDRLRRPGSVHRDRRSTARASRRSGTASPSCTTSGRSRATGWGCCAPWARTCPTRSSRPVVRTPGRTTWPP